MDFAEIVRLLRVIGPNIRLLSKLSKIEESVLYDFLSKIQSLKFTPITKISTLSICEKGIIRRSIKNNKGLALEGDFEVKEIRNYSGIPTMYNFLLDEWDLSLEVKSDYVSVYPHEFDKVERISSLKSLSLKEPLLSMIRASSIKGFIVDYGKRDFYIDVLTFDTDIVDSLQYIPFIRIGFLLKDSEDLPLYLIELFVPEKYLTFTIKIIRYICETKKCQILIATDNFWSSKKII
ncbi:hypothetical protein [Sulfurisphaera ohwakuensis]|uniref:Uncharacterized protein n=1 Tax=Sulfurisphaera ohwakuensis TaxID=69656 RepID=A0A650CJ53_SULOH|nr:hypothetical protein [Sulfurisphaera ohwakuensis]MBB5253445.1 hypothetical protein [Sulfurisphaera ohwakuensis]QGR17758.1 hypothetical protein D1869_11655 [Sulfurisphaera ohwakuensis]